MLDLHALLDVRHPVDDERVRPGDVDDDRGVDLLAVLERHALHTPVPADGHDLPVEQELAALDLGRPLEVVGRELRVVHVPGSRRVDRARQLLLGLLPEHLVVRPSRRPERVDVVVGHTLCQRLRVPVLEFDLELAVVLEDLLVMAGLALEEDRSAIHVLRESALVLEVEIVRPVLPVGEPLVGHGDAVPRRVVRADDGARVARRPVARGRQLVDVQSLVAALRKLEGDRGADHSGPDDDRVGASLHPFLRDIDGGLFKYINRRSRTLEP